MQAAWKYQSTVPFYGVNSHLNLCSRSELSDHLGNVLEVVTDRKLPEESTPNPGTVDHFLANVISYSDYYPYGMLMPNRHSSSESYRYGFQGQEMDDEIKGEGNSVNYKYRMHDPRVGRFFAVDPLMTKFPMMSPYVAFINNPIAFVDPLGLEGEKPGGGGDFVRQSNSSEWGSDRFYQPEDGASLSKQKSSNYNFGNKNWSLFSHSALDEKWNRRPGTMGNQGFGFSHFINEKPESVVPLENASSSPKPLTKYMLLWYYRKHFCPECTDGQLQNRAGHYFEDLFEDYLEREFPVTSKLIIKNTLKFGGEVDDELQHTVPDYIGFYVKSKKILPDEMNIQTIYELKATKNNIGLTTFDDQLKIQVQLAKKTKGKTLSVITTSDITLTKALRRYAWNNGVKLLHYTANYTIVGGRMQISVVRKYYK